MVREHLKEQKIRTILLVKNPLFLLFVHFVLHQPSWHGTVGQLLGNVMVLNTAEQYQWKGTAAFLNLRQDLNLCMVLT